jgi:uncharacterized protein
MRSISACRIISSYDERMKPLASEPETNLNAVPKDERNMAVIAHLAPIAGYLVAIGQILLPLGIYIFGPDKLFVKQQAREALNAQISYTLYWFIVIPLCFIVIGFPLAIVLVILSLWTMIAAALAASDGKSYRYPLIFRFVQ